MLYNPQVIVKGINATKVLDPDKQVGWDDTFNSHCFSVYSHFYFNFTFAFFASNVFFHFSALCKPGYFPIHLQIVLILVLQFSALRWPQNRKETTSILLRLLWAWSKHDFPQTQISVGELETSTLGG